MSTRTPTVSSLSRPWMNDVRADPRFRDIIWDREESVRVRTLTSLIEEFGDPDFVKIDVEGLEEDVLRGLDRPIRALSFEYIPIVRERARACIDRLCELGPFWFRPSIVETTKWATDRWLDANAMKRWLDALRDSDGSGDVYAKRI